jgi:hypothetical protein
MVRKGTSNKVSAQGRGMVLDMLGASVLSDEWERVTTYLHIYVCAAVFRCGKGCEYLRALHLESGAG